MENKKTKLTISGKPKKTFKRFDSSKTDVFDPLFMDKIVSIIAIKKNRAVRIHVSLDNGFADFVPVPKPWLSEPIPKPPPSDLWKRTTSIRKTVTIKWLINNTFDMF